jgi:hypothetical protein
MMQRLTTLVLVFFSLVLFSGCSPDIDKRKFKGVKNSAGAIEQAVKDTTLSFDRFTLLLGRMAEELQKTKESVNNAEEKALLNSFEELFTTFQDGSTLWEYKIGSFQYGWIPRGRIYVDGAVRIIVEKYGFPTESHLVQLTNHHWESISADSLKVIWEIAREQRRKIKTPLFF